jgi:NACHT domain
MTPTPQIIKQYHVFVASPGDVNEERQLIRQFFEQYNRHTAQLWGARFEVVDWENYATVGVGRPQELITKQTLDRYKDSLALVIGIMAQKFGSPTGNAESGTEEEFLWALDSFQKVGFPEIKWFFKRVDQFVAPPDLDAVTKALEQWKKVRAFRQNLKDLDVFFTEYPELNRFRDVFGNDLHLWLADRARPWVVTVAKQDDHVLPGITPPLAYFESIERDFHRLDIAGIDNERAFEIPLSDIYVRLRVMFEEESQAVPDKDFDSGPIDIQTALLRYSKLAIVGDPGSGKSTFLKYVALMLARSTAANNPAVALTKLCIQEPLPIPIFISCWDLSDYLKKHEAVEMVVLLDFIVERLASYGFSIKPNDLAKILSSGNCCLLFDGLDEVPTDLGRAAVSRLLEECVKRFANNRYIVTSRIRAYTGDTILKGEFTRCDIQPFDANDRAEFLKNWVGLLFKIEPSKVAEGETDASREFQSLIQAIETNDRIRPLAVNPLLLTVIAIVHWNRKRLPEQRVDLYDECVDVLLGQRKEAEHILLGRKTGAFDEKHEQQQREERAWIRKRFAEIALHILAGEDNGDETTKTEIVKLLVARFIDRGATTNEQAETRASFFLETQERRSGLLVSRREHSYRFVHLTFQEYLSAWQLSNLEFDQVIQLLAPHLRKQRWFETLQLLAGQWAKQSDEKLDKYLAWLLKQQGASIAERAPIIALCANIVKDTAGIAELTPETRKIFRAGVEGTLDAFQPASGIPVFTQLEILEALGQLGAAVKTHLITASKSGRYQVRRRAVEMLLPHLLDDELFEMHHLLEDRSKEPIKTYLLYLIARDTSRTASWLQKRTIFSQRATEGFSEIVHFFEQKMTPSEFQTVLLSVFNKGNSYYLWNGTIYNNYLPSRARLVYYIKDTDVIRSLITDDREPAVRAMATNHLVKRQPNDTELLSLLSKRMSEDDNFWVRLYSLKHLTESVTDDQTVRALIFIQAYKEKESGPDPKLLVQHAYVHETAARLKLTIPVVQEHFDYLAKELQNRYGFLLRLAWDSSTLPGWGRE